MEDRERIYEFSKLKLNWDQLMEEIGKQLKTGTLFYITKNLTNQIKIENCNCHICELIKEFHRESFHRENL